MAESTHTSSIEQLVIFIRWEDKEMTVCEEYIGLMPVAKRNTDTVVVRIKDVLLHMNLRIHNARGQCYDQCSTMTGTKYGVVAQITKVNKKCLPTLCYCHAT